MKKKKRAILQPQLNQVNKWIGQLEGYANGYLYGWAINSRDTDQRVSLEVCLNQECIGLVSANLAHQKLNGPNKKSLPLVSSQCDPCHGFVAEVGQLHKGSTYSIRIANTEIYLPGLVESKDETKETDHTPTSILSAAYSAGGLRLYGYVVPSRRDVAYEILYAYCEGERVAQTMANRTLPSLRGGLGDGFGFEINLPLKFADGKLHNITIKSASGYELNGSPLQVCCLQQGLQTLFNEEKGASYQKLIAMYETYLPHSLAWHEYASWAERFSLCERSLPNLGHLVLTVLFDTQSSIAELKQSRESLEEFSQASGIKIDELNREKITVNELKQKLKLHQIGYTLFLQAGMCLDKQNMWAMISSAENANAKMVYGDTEFAGIPWFKPAWNLEYALSSDCIIHATLCKNSVVLSGLSDDLAKDATCLWLWDIALQLDQSDPDSIEHFPYVVSRRQTVALPLEQQRYERQLIELLLHRGLGMELTEHPIPDKLRGYACARRLLRTITPAVKTLKICLIIPTRDQYELLQRCISSIQSFSNWPHLEIIVVDNGSVKDETHNYFKVLKAAGIRVIASPGPFNYSYLNNLAVAYTSADIIGLINNDIEATHHGWLDEMMSHFSDDRIAMVGAKLMWPNGMVQHGGVVLGPSGVAAHYGNLLHEDDPGHFGRNQLTQQLSAVTAACLLVRRNDWVRVGGLNQIDFPVAFNDVDLCLKLRALGRRIIWTPFAKLLHLESASRGKEDSPQKQARAQRELANLRRRWGPSLLADPSYHPSLNLDAHAQVFTGFALPPRSRGLRSAKLLNIPQQTQQELDSEPS